MWTASCKKIPSESVDCCTLFTGSFVDFFFDFKHDKELGPNWFFTCLLSIFFSVGYSVAPPGEIAALQCYYLSPIILVSGASYEASYEVCFESVGSEKFSTLVLVADNWYKRSLVRGLVGSSTKKLDIWIFKY